MNRYVLALFTGGTISFVKEEIGAEPEAGLGSRELLPKGLSLPTDVTIRSVDVYKVMSESLTWSHVTTLVRAVEEAMKDEHLVGIVVSHGTDTMEEVSYLLDLAAPWPKPIVFTGAMRHSALPSADGEANLRDAIAVVVDERSPHRGVLVVMNQEIHAARYVAKAHSTSLAAFASPGRGPMGSVREGVVEFNWQLPPHERYYAIPAVQPGVELIRLGLAPSPLLLRACLDMAAEDGGGVQECSGSTVEGVVIEGYGAGHVSEHLLPVLSQLVEKVPVWVVPRTAAGGPLSSTYTYPGSEKTLLEMGIRLEEGPGIKARLRMMLEIASASGK